jgi:hypothetical protein
MDHQNLLNRALAAYFKASSEGLPIQPSNESGVEDVEGKKYVVLRNVNGLLKVYRVRNDGVLKGLKRWPAEIQ